MQTKGPRLISELKAHVFETVKGIPECQSGQSGVSYSEIENLAGLDSDLLKTQTIS